MTDRMNSRSLVAAGLALTIAGLIAWVATTLSTSPGHHGAVEVTQLSTLTDAAPAKAERKTEVLVTQITQ